MNKLQNYSVLRIFYFRLKEDINPLIFKARKNVNKVINESDKCYENKFNLYLSILNNDSINKSNKLLITFLEDVEKSSKLKELPIIYMVNSIPIPINKCKKAIVKRQKLVKYLDNTFSDFNINFVDFNDEIYKENNYEIVGDSLIKFDKGHLNYNGHYLYSKVLTRVIKDFIKKKQINLIPKI